jgi:anion-transporting  ArsA/GET3 family ATPase
MDGILDRRLVVVMGKGGTGKSTVAAALGLAGARRGKRVLLCEVAGRRRVQRVLSGRAAGDLLEEAELRAGLWGISVEPQAALEEYLRSQLPSRALFELLRRSRVFQYLVAAAPGSRELLTIGKIWETAQLDRPWTGAEGRYDLVVVDAPATGHGLALLESPSTFRDIAGVGRIQRQAGRIDSFLRDPAMTAVVGVALPEEMPVSETLELGSALKRQMGLELDLVVMNALYPERFDEAELESIRSAMGAEGLSDGSREALAAAVSEGARATAQREQLRRLEDSGRPVAALPHVFAQALGVDELEALSVELERSL